MNKDRRSPTPRHLRRSNEPAAPATVRARAGGIGRARRRPGRPPAASVQGERVRVLRVALDSFLAHGFEGTSISVIARRSQVSRDTLYRQYGSKQELFRAATGYGLARLAEHLRVAVGRRGRPQDVLLRAAVGINTDMSSPQALPVLRLIIAEAHRFPDVGRQMFEDSRASLAPLVEYLERQRSAGVLAFEDAFEAAFMFSTLAFGGVRIFLEPWPQSRAMRRRWAARVVRYLLDGWRVGAQLARSLDASERRLRSPRSEISAPRLSRRAPGPPAPPAARARPRGW